MVCTCGHVQSEHALNPGEPEYLGCKVEACDCFAFEWNGVVEEDVVP